MTGAPVQRALHSGSFPAPALKLCLFLELQGRCNDLTPLSHFPGAAHRHRGMTGQRGENKRPLTMARILVMRLKRDSAP